MSAFFRHRHGGAAAAARRILRSLRKLLPAALVRLVVATPALADCEDAKPIFYLTFSSDTASADQVTDFADRVAGNHLRHLPGVADVAVFGGRHLAMRISLDPSRLAALGLTPQDVEDVLRRQNVELSPRRSAGAAIEYRLQPDRRSPQEFADIVVRQDGDYVVRLADVAGLELGVWGGGTTASYGGREVVALGISKQPASGLVPFYFAVRTALSAIRTSMPAGMQIEAMSPFSIVIERTIEE
jgi:multidrug efflux pump